MSDRFDAFLADQKAGAESATGERHAPRERGEVVGSIYIDRENSVRVLLLNRDDGPAVDLRVWRFPHGGRHGHSTGRGFRLREHQLPDFAAAVARAVELVKERATTRKDRP